jgi:hypothetical protein
MKLMSCSSIAIACEVLGGSRLKSERFLVSAAGLLPKILFLIIVGLA